jgi:gliding motility-associated-like protein
VTDPCCELSVPNVFSPNGDGVNDYFEVTAQCYDSVQIVVYNRWGVKIWQSETPLGSWDGRTPFGREASSGTYYYVVNAQTDGGQTTTQTGQITISR